MTERCPEHWEDTLDQRTNTTIRCALTAQHDGPHRNYRAGITWGGPTDWFGDAA